MCQLTRNPRAVPCLAVHCQGLVRLCQFLRLLLWQQVSEEHPEWQCRHVQNGALLVESSRKLLSKRYRQIPYLYPLNNTSNCCSHALCSALPACRMAAANLPTAAKLALSAAEGSACKCRLPGPCPSQPCDHLSLLAPFCTLKRAAARPQGFLAALSPYSSGSTCGAANADCKDDDGCCPGLSCQKLNYRATSGKCKSVRST